MDIVFILSWRSDTLPKINIFHRTNLTIQVFEEARDFKTLLKVVTTQEKS